MVSCDTLPACTIKDVVREAFNQFNLKLVHSNAGSPSSASAVSEAQADDPSLRLTQAVAMWKRSVGPLDKCDIGCATLPTGNFSAVYDQEVTKLAAEVRVMCSGKMRAQLVKHLTRRPSLFGCWTKKHASLLLDRGHARLDADNAPATKTGSRLKRLQGTQRERLAQILELYVCSSCAAGDSDDDSDGGASAAAAAGGNAGDHDDSEDGEPAESGDDGKVWAALKLRQLLLRFDGELSPNALSRGGIGALTPLSQYGARHHRLQKGDVGALLSCWRASMCAEVEKHNGSVGTDTAEHLPLPPPLPDNATLTVLSLFDMRAGSKVHALLHRYVEDPLSTPTVCRSVVTNFCSVVFTLRVPVLRQFVAWHHHATDSDTIQSHGTFSSIRAPPTSKYQRGARSGLVPCHDPAVFASRRAGLFSAHALPSPSAGGGPLLPRPGETWHYYDLGVHKWFSSPHGWDLLGSAAANHTRRRSRTRHGARPARVPAEEWAALSAEEKKKGHLSKDCSYRRTGAIPKDIVAAETALAATPAATNTLVGYLSYVSAYTKVSVGHGSLSVAVSD